MPRCVYLPLVLKSNLRKTGWGSGNKTDSLQISDDELVEQFASGGQKLSDSAVLTEFFTDLTAPDFRNS